MKVIIIGAVGTTAQTIKLLHKHGFEIVGVLGHIPPNPNRVSGLNDLQSLCIKLGLEFQGFRKINQAEHIAWARDKQPEVIFAVGFSQLLSDEWLTLPSKGCIGFHPTVLPEGRGRAPVAWTILDRKDAAASFFLMGRDADEGPIFVQEIFRLDEGDDAEDYIRKLNSAIQIALDNWLPKLKIGEWNPTPQNNQNATYYGKREPCDSVIDWNRNAIHIDRLIKSSTYPHPGAFTFCNEKIVTILKSRVDDVNIYRGVVGRILLIENGSLLVQCADNSNLWIDKYEYEEPDIKLKIGDKFGSLQENQQDKIINNFAWKNEK